MKTRLLTPFALATVMLLASCEDLMESTLTETTPTRQPSVSATRTSATTGDATQQILDRIARNAQLSYPLFQTLRDRLPAATLLAIKKTSTSKPNFINTVARKSSGYFNDVTP